MSPTRSARINPVKQMIALAHARGVPVLVDGAQAVPHLRGRRAGSGLRLLCLLGPQDVRPDRHRHSLRQGALLETMQPFKGGGDMILSVTFEKTTYNTIPHKFEAGTPPIAAAIGLGAAVDYLSAIGMDRHRGARARTAAPMRRERLASCPACASSARPRDKAAVLSFTVEGVHPHDVGTLLNEEGDRGAHRPPLRATGDAALRRAGDRARLVRFLQHAGRGRRAGRRHPRVQKMFA